MSKRPALQMPRRTLLKGTETDTLELDGTLPSFARSLVPAPLSVPDGAVHVNVLFFSMHGLTLRGLRWPGFDYREALWRISVLHDSQPAWFAIACDLDSAVIRALGRRVVRYPTRVARFEGHWSLQADGATFSARITEEPDSPAPLAARRTFVRSGSRVYEIPWEETSAPERHRARVEVLADSLSARTFQQPVTWASSGLVHRGRIHQCGIAHRLVTFSPP